jgi:RNA polymerase sigma factor (sigma-70 family)
MVHQISRHAFPDSAELYAACRSVDPLVQADAYEALWGYLYQVVLQMVHDQPDAEDLAQDCAQIALIRVHERLAECREPAAFRAWARRIASRVAIDELRSRRKLVPFPEDDAEETSAQPIAYPQPPPEVFVLEEISRAELRDLISRAPISERSRRVVLGRYLDDIPDEQLAQEESRLEGRPVLPSHLQVTRAKNIAVLRDWEPLRRFWANTSRIEDGG